VQLAPSKFFCILSNTIIKKVTKEEAMRKGIVCLSFLIVFSFYFAQGAYADEITELKVQIKTLQARIEALETAQETVQAKQAKTAEKVAKIETIPSILEGINISAGATFVVQGTHNANGDNSDNDGEDAGDSSYSIDLTFEKEFEDYGKAVINFEAGGGGGVEDELKLFSNVNADADNDENLRLTKAFYEHYLKSLPLTLVFGKIGANDYIDTNNYANDECTQFLSRMFKNSPAIELADNGPGVGFTLKPTGLIDINLVMVDADSEWEDMFDNIFLAGQINLKTNLFNREGNYRIVAWLNDQAHTRWSDSLSTKDDGYGFGISFDQEITDNLGAFIRYGWQDPGQRLNGLDDDFSLEHSWSTGLQFNGNIWGRDKDVFAFAIGQVIPSSDYKNSGNLNAKNEGHFEVYYSYVVNDHLTLSPDIQAIWNPYGKDAATGDDMIIVGGLRGQVDF